MTASPLDSEFLKLSQMSDETDFIVALLEGKDSHVTASSRADAVPPGAGLEDIRKDYIVMVKEFLDFGYSDLELKYATIFSKKDAFARRNVILSKGTTDHVLYSSILSLLLFAALMYKRSMRGMKSALQTIVSSKEYMENIMSSLNDGIIVVSRKGDVMMLNAAASQLLGYEEKELAGRPLCELLPDAPSERTLDGAGDAVTLAQESAGGSIKRYEASCVSKSGVVIPVMVSRSLLEDKFGLVLGFVIVLQDITRRKQAEDTIRHNYILQQVINLVLELSLRPVSMDTLAAECLDLIISVPKLHTEKKGSIHLVGDEPEVLIMKAQRGLSKEILDSCAVLPFGKCLCGRAALKREIIFDDHVGDDHEIRFDGMTPHGHYCAPIISGDRVLGVINLYVRAGHVKTDSETHFLSSIANALAGVIERKQAESELLKARDNLERKAAELEKTNSELKETTGQLVQSGKLSALGELTAGVAHELNQPLNGIKIICQSILRDIEKGRHDEAELCDDLKQIVGQVNKMAEIIDHMRIFTRRSEGMLTEMLDINKVVRSPFIFLGQQLKNNNIEVVLELAEGLPQVKGDAIRLEQVFMNLITNAKNAMEKIGDRPRRLTIRTLSCDGSAGLQAGLQDGAGVCVEFQDNGSGIPTDLIEKIFQPFFTTNEPGKGTGLGLSLSNKIVQEHGGRVLVESEAGVGTLFRVLLPAGPNNPASIIKEEIDA
jgi:PAS domain S-box-containing protein